jgi:hypothetical protein
MTMRLRHRFSPLLYLVSGLILLSASATLVTGSGLAGPDDSFATVTPQVVRDSVMERFSGFHIWAIKTTGAEDKTVHEVTVFDARSTGLHGRRVDGSMLHTRVTYRIVVSGTGDVISEERHSIPEDSVPRAALQAFLEWRRSRPAEMAVIWAAYQEPHEERLYVASIIVNALESHMLVVSKNGIIIRESQIESEDAG